MFDAGAGKLGNYENCAWQTKGVGQFKPIANANPNIGKINKLEKITEYKLEMLCKESKLASVIDSMKTAHPYEEVAYCVVVLKNI